MKTKLLILFSAVSICVALPFIVSALDSDGGRRGEGSPPPNPPAAREMPDPFQPPAPLEPGGGFKAPGIRLISPGVYEIGGIQVLKKEMQVTFPCKVNMDKGLLEYVIVGRAGKLHESLLKTDVEPFALQVALLLIGLEGTTNPLSSQGASETPQGTPVDLLIEWGGADRRGKGRIEEWVSDHETGSVMPETSWIFTGSMTSPQGVFMAQLEKSIAAVYHDPVAMIDNPLPRGGVHGIWFVNEGKVPPPGTDVTVTIRKTR